MSKAETVTDETAMNVKIPRPTKARLAYAAVIMGRPQNDIIVAALEHSLDRILKSGGQKHVTTHPA